MREKSCPTRQENSNVKCVLVYEVSEVHILVGPIIESIDVSS